MNRQGVACADRQNTSHDRPTYFSLVRPTIPLTSPKWRWRGQRAVMNGANEWAGLMGIRCVQAIKAHHRVRWGGGQHSGRVILEPFLSDCQRRTNCDQCLLMPETRNFHSVTRLACSSLSLILGVHFNRFPCVIGLFYSLLFF